MRKIGQSIGCFDVVFDAFVKCGSIIMLVDFSYHPQIHDWGSIYFPLKEENAWDTFLEVTNFLLILSTWTSIDGFHKRLKKSIDFYKRSFLGRNKSQDQCPGLGTKFRDQSLQASKWCLKRKYRPEKWITCSL